jgi:hypothetical protein
VSYLTAFKEGHVPIGRIAVLSASAQHYFFAARGRNNTLHVAGPPGETAP